MALRDQKETHMTTLRVVSRLTRWLGLALLGLDKLNQSRGQVILPHQAFPAAPYRLAPCTLIQINHGLRRRAARIGHVCRGTALEQEAAGHDLRCLQLGCGIRYLIHRRSDSDGWIGVAGLPFLPRRHPGHGQHDECTRCGRL